MQRHFPKETASTSISLQGVRGTKKEQLFPSPALPFMIIGCRAIFRALGHQVLLYATIKDHLHDIISRGLCN